jgi:hypothetical protein
METLYILMVLAFVIAIVVVLFSEMKAAHNYGREKDKLKDGELWMPHAELQGDEPVKVRPEDIGPRDNCGRFEKIPNLGEVLKASSYNQPRQ